MEERATCCSTPSKLSGNDHSPRPRTDVWTFRRLDV
jgi:hypothetical protein